MEKKVQNRNDFASPTITYVALAMLSLSTLLTPLSSKVWSYTAIWTDKLCIILFCHFVAYIIVIPTSDKRDCDSTRQ